MNELPQLHGFVYAVLGSNPEHTIYAVFHNLIGSTICENN